MKPDVAIAELREQRPGWDDLLARRVLVRVRESHARRATRRRIVRRTATFAVLLVVLTAAGTWAAVRGKAESGVVSELVAIESIARSGPASAEGPADALPPAGPPSPPGAESVPAANGAGGVLSLADGSRVTFDDGTELHTTMQTEVDVALVQRDGRAHYAVSDDPGRQFVVQVGAYELRASATVFVVEVAGDRFTAAVEMGSLRIHGAGRDIDLQSGERIELGSSARPQPEGQDVSPGPATSASARGVDAHLRDADRARREGRLVDAAGILRRLVAAYPRDARAPSAWFMLGRVERQRHRHEQAARAFRRAWSAAKRGALAEDARAEEAVSWHDAGATQRAIEAATRYLELHPAGTHASRIRAIVR